MLLGFMFLIGTYFQIVRADESQVSLVDHGMHTGIILEASDIRAHWPDLAALHPEVDHFEFGMGEDPFFREKNHSILGGLRAMLVPTDSLVRIHPFKGEVKSRYDGKNLSYFSFSAERIKAMIQWFKNDMKGKLELVEADKTKSYYFFARKGSYHFFNNCNHWVATAMEQLDVELSWSQKLWSSRMFKALALKADSSTMPITKGSWLVTFEKYLF